MESLGEAAAERGQNLAEHGGNWEESHYDFKLGFWRTFVSQAEGADTDAEFERVMLFQASDFGVQTV